MVAHWRHTMSTLPDDLCCNTLVDLTLCATIDRQREIGMGMQVNKPWRDGQTLHIDSLRTFGIF